ncbi:hypothetical protein PU345_002110 [Enterobacter kobei]|nr:hypothetical protein [Enterobacter kobei]
MSKSIHVKKIDIEIKKIRPDTFKFNLDDVLQGSLHITPFSGCQIELDGGYRLTEEHCIACAIESLAKLHSDFDHAEALAGLNYQTYKKVFREGVNSVLNS